jgi:hypothetical protein
MNKQQFWFDDISILINQDYLQDFIPVKEMNTSEKLNAIMRFCMYLSLILILITGNSNYIFIVICGAILTYIIHINKDEETIKNKNENVNSNTSETNTKEELSKPIYEPPENEQIKPTPDNLFGNVSVVDIGNKKTEDAPKDSYETQFQELLKKDTFNEQDNMYEDKMSLRQMYKVPNTFDSESRKKFMNWCYEPSKK